MSTPYSTSLWAEILVASCLSSMKVGRALLNFFPPESLCFSRLNLQTNTQTKNLGYRLCFSHNIYKVVCVIGIWHCKGFILIMQSSQRMCCTITNLAVERRAMSQGRLMCEAPYWTKRTSSCACHPRGGNGLETSS